MSFVETRTSMNINETMVEETPATRRKATVPTTQQSPPPAPEGTKSPSDETVNLDGGPRLQLRNGTRRRRSADSTRQSSYGEKVPVRGHE